MQNARRKKRVEEAPIPVAEPRPRPTLAVVLGLVPYAWGLGHWYVGDRGRAALMHFAELAVMTATCFLLPSYGAAVLALPFGLWLASAVDAGLRARATTAFHAPRRRRFVTGAAFWIAANIVV